MEAISINDELLLLKQHLRKSGLIVVGIEKVGNGNMAAFRLSYRKDAEEESKQTFFWRHDLDRFIEEVVPTL